MSKIKFVKGILKGDYMKISEMVSKSVIDKAITDSSSVETLCTALLTIVVSAVVVSIFSKKENNDERGSVIK